MLPLLIAVGCLGGAVAVLTFWTVAAGVSLWREASAWLRDLFCDEQPIVHVAVDQTHEETQRRIRSEVDRMRARAALMQNVEPVSEARKRQVLNAMARIGTGPQARGPIGIVPNRQQGSMEIEKVY